MCFICLYIYCLYVSTYIANFFKHCSSFPTTKLHICFIHQMQNLVWLVRFALQSFYHSYTCVTGLSFFVVFRILKHSKILILFIIIHDKIHYLTHFEPEYPFRSMLFSILQYLFSQQYYQKHWQEMSKYVCKIKDLCLRIFSRFPITKICTVWSNFLLPKIKRLQKINQSQ